MGSAKKKNENIIEGRTRSGIVFCIDKRIKEDARALMYMRKLRRFKEGESEAAEAVDALYDFLELLFGSGDGLRIFCNEVAEKHDGFATASALMTELNEILEACNLKNSSSSQK